MKLIIIFLRYVAFHERRAVLQKIIRQFDSIQLPRPQETNKTGPRARQNTSVWLRKELKKIKAALNLLELIARIRPASLRTEKSGPIQTEIIKGDPLWYQCSQTDSLLCYLIRHTKQLDLFSTQHHVTLTFSARPSLAEHCSVLNSNSCFLAIHSSYLAWRDAMPSSTSASRALASARTRWVSCSSSVACFRAAYGGRQVILNIPAVVA